MYLKGFTGSVYTGFSWEPLPDSSFSEIKRRRTRFITPESVRPIRYGDPSAPQYTVYTADLLPGIKLAKISVPTKKQSTSRLFSLNYAAELAAGTICKRPFHPFSFAAGLRHLSAGGPLSRPESEKPGYERRFFLENGRWKRKITFKTHRLFPLILRRHWNTFTAPLFQIRFSFSSTVRPGRLWSWKPPILALHMSITPLCRTILKISCAAIFADTFHAICTRRI